MKKKMNFKRFLAGLMSSAMVLSTMSLSAFSADTATTDTIDTSKDVSLTIYKYDYTAANGETEFNGTGSSTDTVPENAKGLNDVTFTVYKIADIEQTTDDGVVGIKYKTLEDIAGKGTTPVPEYIDGGMSPASIKSMFVDDTTVNDILNRRTTNIASQTTATVDSVDGVAKFTNSDLSGQGLYLVVETAKPDKVTSEMAPFLVSLPTTLNTTDTDGTVTDSGWLYDVYAFPKNSTQTSAIVIKKYSKVADEATTESIANATFYIQKKNANDEWVTLTADADGTAIGSTETGKEGLLTVPAVGLTVSNLAPGDYRLIEASAPDLYIAESDVSYEFTIDADGSVTVGTKKTTQIDVINDKPTVEKEVLKKNGDETKDEDWTDQVDYSVGDTVTFKISVTVPDSISKLSTYKIVDSFEDGVFTVKEDSFDYTFYTGEGTAKTESTAITAPTNTPDVTSTGWTLDLTADKATLADKGITAIEITFDATLTNKAVTAGQGNLNNVSLEFTNHVYPDSEEDPDNPVTPEDPDVKEETTTITDSVVVYTFGLQLVKTFKDGTASATVNATFDLYEKSADGTETIKVDGTSVAVKKIGTYTTDENGKITINTSQTEDSANDTAVSNGTYYFVETKTADGYNLLADPVEVTVQKYYTKTFATTTTVTKYDENGDVIPDPVVTTSGTETTTYYSDAEKATTIVDEDGNATTEIEDLTTSVSVENRKGFSFPVTGGKGTILFTVVGLGLMILAVCVFFASKKRKSNQ